MRNLRNRLEKNRIYFDTTVAIVEIAVVIFLALTGMNIASQANQIAENQTKLMQNQTQLMRDQTKIMRSDTVPDVWVSLTGAPSSVKAENIRLIKDYLKNEGKKSLPDVFMDISFNIRSAIFGDTESYTTRNFANSFEEFEEYYDVERLSFSNLGAPIRSFGVTILVFFRVGASVTDKNGDIPQAKIKSLLIPVVGYYNNYSYEETGKPTGELAHIDTLYGSIRPYLLIQRDACEIEEISVERYLKIRYQDKYGDKQVKYYCVDDDGQVELTQKKGEKVFLHYDSCMEKSISIFAGEDANYNVINGMWHRGINAGVETMITDPRPWDI